MAETTAHLSFVDLLAREPELKLSLLGRLLLELSLDASCIHKSLLMSWMEGRTSMPTNILANKLFEAFVTLSSQFSGIW